MAAVRTGVWCVCRRASILLFVVRPPPNPARPVSLSPRSKTFSTTELLDENRLNPLCNGFGCVSKYAFFFSGSPSTPLCPYSWRAPSLVLAPCNPYCPPRTTPVVRCTRPPPPLTCARTWLSFFFYSPPNKGSASTKQTTLRGEVDSLKQDDKVDDPSPPPLDPPRGQVDEHPLPLPSSPAQRRTRAAHQRRVKLALSRHWSVNLDQGAKPLVAGPGSGESIHRYKLEVAFEFESAGQMTAGAQVVSDAQRPEK